MFRTLTCMVVLVVFLACVPGCFREGRAPNGPITTFSDSGKSPLAADISIVEPAEVDLVESVLQYRAAYHRQLTQLRDYYGDHGFITKQSWADFELKGLRRVKPFKYLLDAEIASDKLRPTDEIPEANAMFEEARSLMRRGGFGGALLVNRDLMVEASQMLCAMIETFPSSDKIDDAAFFLGEIHTDYIPDSAVIAVLWYERAFTWNPATPHPARFKAAVVYDYRLQDRARALELYHSVISSETGNEKNLRASTRRIRELTSP